MDLLATQVEVYAAKKSPADKARHSVLQTLAAVATVYERMARTLKDKGDLVDFLDKCISGKPILLRELLEVVEKGEECKTQLKVAKEAEKRKEERALAKIEKAAKAAEIPLATAVTATNTVTNVFINIGSALMSALAATVPPPTVGKPVLETPAAKPKAYKKRKIGAGLKEALWHKVCGDECVKIKCPVCQIRDLREKDFVAGHIDAERGGGETSIDNLIPICNKCNSCMATRNMMDYCRETYKRELVLPVRK